ncbi:hypothetical protein TIFTF001_033479 [Ficus carica]|uniref:Uncharacterized protein n=1 Tax=Ficus carica TaxID=3494 RepID=A0AA88DYV5_FICCA|nr:hypothetical protein TIFTF001_033479 [Ficus carica]
MVKPRGKRTLEEHLDTPTSVDLDDCDAKDDKLASVLCSSRDDHELEPPRQISTESVVQMVNPPSILTEHDLALIRGQYGVPNELQLLWTSIDDPYAHHPMYEPIFAGNSPADAERQIIKEVTAQSTLVRGEPKTITCPAKLRGGRDQRVLRRLLSTLLFIKPLYDKEALITELALSMMHIEFPSPKELLVRKRVEKEVAKAAPTAKAAEATH